jgi:hypothetical protein
LAIRSFFAAIFEYKPGFVAIVIPLASVRFAI